MEVGQGQNWGCSAKGKKIIFFENMLKTMIIFTQERKNNPGCYATTLRKRRGPTR
jgi:hypothetical protein